MSQLTESVAAELAAKVQQRGPYCKGCGWPVYLSDREFEKLDEVKDRPTYEDPNGFGRDMVYCHAFEPAGHLPDPEGTPNDDILEILQGRP